MPVNALDIPSMPFFLKKKKKKEFGGGGRGEKKIKKVLIKNCISSFRF